MADKLYRVKKDTFMWLKGAIIKLTSEGSDGGYIAISDLWDVVPLNGEYISRRIIEHPDNSEFFERVHDVTVLGKLRYLTTPEARKAHEELYKAK